ncbi:MAG: hypothetical protein LBT02_00350 [Rickettsiales bacterium]|jgi:hypothetical protein|nr:hypothetical protein [Rickettsiales bacterium]
MTFLTLIVTKLIPSNWFTVIKTCDIVEKICDTIIELKWFVFPTIIIVVICLMIIMVYYFKWQIKKIRR